MSNTNSNFYVPLIKLQWREELDTSYKISKQNHPFQPQISRNLRRQGTNIITIAGVIYVLRRNGTNIIKIAGVIYVLRRQGTNIIKIAKIAGVIYVLRRNGTNIIKIAKIAGVIYVLRRQGTNNRYSFCI